jgi:hypothetical protein
MFAYPQCGGSGANSPSMGLDNGISGGSHHPHLMNHHNNHDNSVVGGGGHPHLMNHHNNHDNSVVGGGGHPHLMNHHNNHDNSVVGGGHPHLMNHLNNHNNSVGGGGHPHLMNHQINNNNGLPTLAVGGPPHNVARFNPPYFPYPAYPANCSQIYVAVKSHVVVNWENCYYGLFRMVKVTRPFCYHPKKSYCLFFLFYTYYYYVFLFAIADYIFGNLFKICRPSFVSDIDLLQHVVVTFLYFILYFSTLFMKYIHEPKHSFLI